MTASIIILVLVVITAMVIFDTKPGAFLKGMYGMFFEDMATTPEGAKALYQKAQEEAETRYTKAKGTLELVAGQCQASRRRLAETQAKLTQCEKTCEMFAKQGKDEELRLYAAQRVSFLDTIKFEQETITRLEPTQIQAQKIVDALGDQIRKLEQEKTQRITELQMSRNMQKVYASMDELASDSEIDKLLKATQRGAEEAKQKAEGAKVVHENSLSAKLDNAARSAAQLDAEAYIQSLKQAK